MLLVQLRTLIARTKSSTFGETRNRRNEVVNVVAVYTSEELVHLVGSKHPHDDEANYRTLSLILGSGEIRTRRMEEGEGATGYLTHRSGSLVDESRLDPNVTCFADIPRRSLAIHVTKYGRFGLAFDRVRLAHLGARPVMYVPKRRTEFFAAIGGAALMRDIDGIHEGLLRHCEKQLDGIKRAIRRTRNMGAVRMSSRFTSHPSSSHEPSEPSRTSDCVRRLS